MIALLIIAVFLLCAYCTIKLMLADWRGEFGDYEGCPFILIVAACMMGPLGTMLALFIWVSNPYNRRRTQ